jgi:hypothetical protein
MVGRDSFSTLLTLAALQENGNNAAAAASAASAGVAAAAAAAAAAAVSAANSTGCVPLPPSLDPHRSLPVTPTTPTSTGQFNTSIHSEKSMSHCPNNDLLPYPQHKQRAATEIPFIVRPN